MAEITVMKSHMPLITRVYTVTEHGKRSLHSRRFFRPLRVALRGSRVCLAQLMLMLVEANSTFRARVLVPSSLTIRGPCERSLRSVHWLQLLNNESPTSAFDSIERCNILDQPPADSQALQSAIVINLQRIGLHECAACIERIEYRLLFGPARFQQSHLRSVMLITVARRRIQPTTGETISPA